MRLILLIGVAAAVLAGCAGGGGSGTTLKEGPSVPGFEFTQESGVSEGETIDRRFTCDGENVSPALSWTGVPDETKELALAFDDPDAPGGTFTHWLAYGLDPSTSELPGGGSTEGWTGYAPLFRQGRNDFGDTGYGGPCPPGGEEHRYVFRLLALDGPVELEDGVSREEFDDAVEPHVLAEARLTARYARL